MTKENGSELAELWPTQMGLGSRSVDFIYDLANETTPLVKKEIKYLLLLNRGARTQSELSELCATNQANTARAINSLMEKGLVERAEKIDGRSYSVRLTEDGRELCDKVLNGLASVFVKSLGDITEEEYQVTVKVLRILHSSL